MNKTLKLCIAAIVVIAALVLAYRLFFIRVVNYEIAGIQIPSRYDIITGKVTPLVNYKGKAIRAIVESHKANELGLSDEQVALAQLKWALFEQWADSRPQYKGWDTDPRIMKEANEEFRRRLKIHG